jgi:hypothetical protein
MISRVSHRPDYLHAVTFYENPASLCRIVAEFVGTGLSDRQPALLIATPDHGTDIFKALRSRGIDPERLEQDGELLMLDAVDTLALFMVNGMPDASRFADVAGSALAQLRDAGTGCSIRAYGEMVDVLWKQGQDAAAIRLEMLWNKLAHTQDFSLLCGYAMGTFYKSAGRSAIHHQHTHVISGQGDLVPCARP